ncbi:hypothetical protein GCM10028790_21060 [Micromonospora taraxaci]|uniref:Cupin domain n=2 Tax=Micromonospora taraxaci TaxID=1316803 RepID=A0A561VWP4_9ACTN|nr:cupin domain [Micromonospora taraxaci]
MPPLFPRRGDATDVIHASRPTSHDGGGFDQSKRPTPRFLGPRSGNARSVCRQTHRVRRDSLDGMPNTNSPSTSGPVAFAHWYDFAEGGPVHQGLLPFPASAPAPFEVARWSVAPNTCNDLDVHRSREVWIIVSGTGTLTFGDQTSVLRAGDVAAFDSRVPHQIRNDGPDQLLAVSVYWLQGSD